MYSSVLAWKSQAKVAINIVAPAAVKKVLPVGSGGDIPPSPTQFRAIQSHRTISSKTSWINLRCSIGRTAANSSKMSCRPPIRTNKLRGQTRQGWREARGQGIRGPCQAPSTRLLGKLSWHGGRQNISSNNKILEARATGHVPSLSSQS